MAALNLDNEIVASTFDEASGNCSYTIARGGKRWTVTVPQADLNKHGDNKSARRTHLAKVLMEAMRGPADE